MNDALDGVMRGFRSKLLFAWVSMGYLSCFILQSFFRDHSCLINDVLFQDQDRCTDSGFKTLENKKKPIFLKQFKELSALSWCKGQDTSLNTLLIDNDPYKSLLNPVIKLTITSYLTITVLS